MDSKIFVRHRIETRNAVSALPYDGWDATGVSEGSIGGDVCEMIPTVVARAGAAGAGDHREVEPSSWAAAIFAPLWVGRRLLSGDLRSFWSAVASHPPRPPTDGLCDLQASIADCSCDELDPTPESCTSVPENDGSGKFGTPWARMHWAQFNHACCWEGVSCWPVEFHGDGRDLHA